jgi:cell division protein FtsL
MNYEQISDEYYNSYKAELRVQEGKTLLLSLNKIIKVLFFTLSIILTLLISIYIKNNFSYISTFDIREETQSLNQTIELSSKLNMTPEEFTILVELLKAQITTDNKENNKLTYTLSKNI